MKKKVAVIDNIAAHYRLSLFQKLSQHEVTEYHFFASKIKFLGIETIDPELASKAVTHGGIRWTFIDNIILAGRVVWQKNILRLAQKSDFDIFIFIGEATILSTWIAVLLCRIRNKKVVFWGHGLYGNEKFLKKMLRTAFNRLPDAYLVYNERATKLMAKDGIRPERMFVVNNSLNHDAHVSLRRSITTDEMLSRKKELFPLSNNEPLVIFIGRLTAIKKIDQLIDSLDLIHKHGRKVNALIIGKGEMESSLKQLVSSRNLNEYVCFYGSCYDERENAVMISMSDCCVAPGNSGLIAIHCMSFGTPLITHNDMNNQMPEAETVIGNKTGELFEKDNVIDLEEKIEKVLFVNTREHYNRNCIELIDKYYNPDYQLNIFDQLMGYLNNNNN